MHPILQRKLTEVLDARRDVRRRWGNAIMIMCAAAAAGIGAFIMWRFVDVSDEMWWQIVIGFVAMLLVGSLIVRLWSRAVHLDLTEIARAIEEKHPELHATLLTAVEQKPGIEGYGYMQTRVIEQAVNDAVRQQWAHDLTEHDFSRASWMRAVALLLFAVGFGLMSHKHITGRRHAEEIATTKKAEAPKPQSAFEIEVTPGDAEVEKGTRLVVEAKFTKDVPEDAMLVVSDAKGERARAPMRATVDTKVFGGLVSNIKDDGIYHVEFTGGRSKDFKITTFVHPELDHADATITPPTYAKQPAREVKNTLKVTALEGSQIGWRMKVNKPVKQAELFSDEDHIITLKPDAKDGTTLLADMKPEETRKYRLHLVDDRERANKNPPWFNITVLTNTPPKIEVAFPKRDAKVSALQELPLEAKLWDDLGVDKAGAVIELDNARHDVSLTLGAPDKNRKVGVKTLLNLEPEKVEPLQMVSYYFWAEDKGPKGETRRAMSDMFFAEVRPFEEIFRESEKPPGEDSDGDEEKSPTEALLKMQKDIVNANWRLVRDQNGGRQMPAMKNDVETVKSSQEINDENAGKALEKVKNPKVKTFLQNAQKEMKNAETELAKASDAADAKSVPTALEAEQRALRHLFLAQANEHNVSKSNSKSKSKGKQDAKDQELNELELKQKDKRYEEDKVASEEKTAEQKENLTVLNRLKELARREEALAEKMKQIEQQLAQAKTEDQKEELANQLKRLKDEQEQLLRDLDDLREKMEKPENAANMADAKKQLDETREKVNETLDKMKEEKVAQASASATRAQKDLEKARDDFRQRTAKRFSEEMKQMRDQAKDLATAQQKLDESMENQKKPDTSKDAFDTTASLREQLGNAQQTRQFDEQRERAKKLMEDMQRVSEQAEASEPLLHKHLYEALRDAQMQDLEQNLTAAAELPRRGRRTEAQDANHKASKAVDALKEGVEKAAESVLGNESEALRMARSELDKLINEASGEAGKKPGEAGDKKTAATDGKSDPKDQQPGKNSGGKDPKQTAQKGEGQGEKTGKDGEGKDQKQAAHKGEGKGGKPDGKGSDKDGQQVAQNQQGKGDGKQPGKGDKPKDGKGGDQPGEGEKPGGQQSGKGQVADAKGDQPGDGKGQPQSGKNGKGKQPTNGGNRTASNNAAGGGGGDWFFDAPTEVTDTSPITGDNFNQWSDRLRNVEEMLNQPSLRNEAAKILDHARNLRVDYKHKRNKPLEGPLHDSVLKPLSELRDQITEELARREGRNPLSPIDRDQVPEQYRELVQKYYEQLGAGK